MQRKTVNQAIEKSLPVKLAWFAGLWLAGVASLAAVATILRLVIHS